MVLARKLFVLLLILICIGTASALSISASSQITVGTQWSFEVDFGSLGDAGEAKVFVDDSLAITFFEHGGTVFVDASKNSSQVLSYNSSPGKGVVSFVALNEGTHTVSLQVYSSGTLQDQTSVSIDFYKPLTSAERDSLQTEISSLQGTVSSQADTVSSLQDSLAQKDTEISDLKQQNQQATDSLNSTISALQEKISSLEASGASNDVIVSQLKSDLNVLMEEREQAKKNPLSGFFAFAGDNSILIGLVALCLIVVVVLFFVAKDRSIYSPGISLRRQRFKGSGDSVQTEPTEPQSKGKWGFSLSRQREPKPQPRLSYGDLIRK